MNVKLAGRGVAALFLSYSLFLAACKGGGTTPTSNPPPPANPTVTSVTVVGNTSLTVGGTDQWSATASLSDGTTQNVTSSSSTTWRSNNETFVSVSSGGLVTAKATGSADVSATYQNVTGSKTVNVTPPAVRVTSVTVAGNTSLTVGDTDQWSATASFSDGTTQNVTSSSGTTWASSNDTLVSVSSGGLVTAKAVGSADVSATYQSVKGSRSVSVSPPAPVLQADFTVIPNAGTGFNAKFQCPVNPAPPVNQLLCTFDGTSSSATGGISKYTWEIPSGSGNLFTGATLPENSKDILSIPCGKFGAAGDRLVKLTITTGSGTTFVTKTVTFVKGTPC